MSEFKFPDEIETKNPSAVNGGDEIEIEVVDDTPVEDKGRPPMKEAPAEVTDDELEQYGEGVKKRIQHFSRGYHDERRAKEAALREKEEAIILAQRVLEENKRLQGSLGEGHAALLEQAKQVIGSEIANAKRQYKEAYEAGDSEALLQAQEALTAATIKEDKVNSYKPVAPTQDTVVQPQYQKQPEIKVDAKAKEWKDSNPWFGDNKKMTAVALTIHQDLVDNGVSPTSDEYYERINAEMRETFPSAFPSERKKSTVVASANRSTAPKKIVLTQSQVNIAKRLNVPLELYAKQVAEQSRKNNG